jgi:hypothetical protein
LDIIHVVDNHRSEDFNYRVKHWLLSGCAK